MPDQTNDERAWWERGIIYQVYPRSFQDSDGDGIGDLRGIRQRLDYLENLGVDIVWLSPVYPSPMKDFGYDVADYCGVHPIFGTLEDFDRLLEDLHARRMKLILDFVPNHTSDEHPWFVESRRSRHDPKRDWYIWRDAKSDGSPPNNWLARTGDSAWTWDEGTQQYYYHAYITEQPDLNWRNPEVRRAMTDAMRFWLDRGVDGFRMDVIWHLIKDAELRDNPPHGGEYREASAPYFELAPVYTTDRPEVHEVIAELRGVLDEYDDRMMVGEIYLPIERLVMYYGSRERGGVHLPFNFHLLTSPWNARTVEEVIERYEKALPAHGWPNWVLSNHDKPRIASRTGAAQARVAGMLLLTLRGTPTMYYGDELGLQDVPIPPDRVVDPWEKRQPGIGMGRDPVRTPMQWSDQQNAGFTTGGPWLPLSEDWRERNVARMWEEPRSILAMYRRLLALRAEEPALVSGAYAGVPASGDVLAYRRGGANGGRSFLVALNMGASPARFAPVGGLRGEVVLSTNLDRQGERVQDAVNLRENEGVVIGLLAETAPS